MFRHRIRDLMIVNVVLAVFLAASIALKSFGLVVYLAILVALPVVPLVFLESYLYRRKKGAWYRWRHPVKPRPRYVAASYPLPYPRVAAFQGSGESFLGETPSPPRPRTRLFESGDPSDPVSRASLLLKVAGRLENSGSVVAAVRIYQQVIDSFGDTPEARDAAYRLQSLTQRVPGAGILKVDG
jgi:hypothetical protein